jgi:hypothetical protein
MGGVFMIDKVIFESLAEELHQGIELVDSDIPLVWIKKNH